MLARFAALSERMRFRLLAFPAAALAAALMVGINEVAYREAGDRLMQLTAMGRARVEVLKLQRRVSDAESGKRGYMLVGGPSYLGPYQLANQDVQASLRALKTLFQRANDPKAERLRASLERVVNAKFGEMDAVLSLYDAGRRTEALDMVRSGAGQKLMDELRVEVDNLVAHQNGEIEVGLAQVYNTMRLGRVGVAAMTAVSLLMLMLFVRQGRQMERQREQRQAEIAAERDRLEQEVARRTGDLTELARHLQTAREDERARLARELHDELGALLTAAKLDVARLKPKVQQTLPDLMPRLAHLTESLNSGIALKRRIIEDLRPSTLDSLGLVPALEILCGEFRERSGLTVETGLSAVSLGASADLTVFRVVQEALTNVAKYAQARTVSITLREEAAHAVLTVTDDGTGFDAARTGEGRHGLRGMRFRVEAERGTFDVGSTPGRGTTLRARLPLCNDDGRPSPTRD